MYKEISTRISGEGFPERDFRRRISGEGIGKELQDDRSGKGGCRRCGSSGIGNYRIFGMESDWYRDFVLACFTAGISFDDGGTAGGVAGAFSDLFL